MGGPHGSAAAAITASPTSSYAFTRPSIDIGISNAKPRTRHASANRRYTGADDTCSSALKGKGDVSCGWVARALPCARWAGAGFSLRLHRHPN